MAFQATDVKQPELAKHDAAILDLAFAMDCTASMGSYIQQAKQNIRKIAEEIVASEKSDIHMALVEYRDHPPQDRSFVTQTHDFTPSIGTMKGWLEKCNAQGGGDGPEAVADALHQVLKLSWREEATKICVFISDAPPHGLGTNGCGDGFPNGCPDNIDPLQVARELAEKGVTLYIVGCEPAILASKDFFMAIAHLTGGQYVPLANSELLSKVIIGGAQEEISLQKLMAEVEDNVRQTYASAAPGTVDDTELASTITMQMQAKKHQSRHVSRNNCPLPGASVMQQRFSEATDLKSMNMMAGMCSSTELPAAAPAERASLNDMYDCVEEEVSYTQVSRMMKKAKAKNKLS